MVSWFQWFGGVYEIGFIDHEITEHGNICVWNLIQGILLRKATSSSSQGFSSPTAGCFYSSKASRI